MAVSYKDEFLNTVLGHSYLSYTYVVLELESTGLEDKKLAKMLLFYCVIEQWQATYTHSLLCS